VARKELKVYFFLPRARSVPVKVGLERNRSVVGKTANSFVYPRRQQLTPLPCGGPARLDPSLELNQRDPPCQSPARPPGPRQGVGGGSDRFWARELRVSQHFSTFYESSVQAMDTQLNALPTLPVLAWTVSGCMNSAFLDISQHFTSHLFRPWIPISARHRRWTPMIHRGRARRTISAGSWFGQWSPDPPVATLQHASLALPIPSKSQGLLKRSARNRRQGRVIPRSG